MSITEIKFSSSKGHGYRRLRDFDPILADRVQDLIDKKQLDPQKFYNKIGRLKKKLENKPESSSWNHWIEYKQIVESVIDEMLQENTENDNSKT